MKRLNTLLLLAALAAAPTARAEDATRMGFSFGVRSAYAWPFGDLARDVPLTGTVKSSDVFERLIPLWVDATVRLGGGLELGPYFQYGWVYGKRDFSDAKDWRVGGQVNYRLTPAGGVVPWLGLGAGWNWLKFDNSGGLPGSPDVNGFEMMAQAGADFRVSPHFAIGPFVAYTFGQFSSGDLFNSPINANKGWHEWLHVGAKLSVDL